MKYSGVNVIYLEKSGFFIYATFRFVYVKYPLIDPFGNNNEINGPRSRIINIIKIFGLILIIF